MLMIVSLLVSVVTMVCDGYVKYEEAEVDRNQNWRRAAHKGDNNHG